MLVLDVFIGLVLIYFLYSLLSSIVAEMISTWIGMRARMLRQGIDNLLNDIKIGTNQDFFRWIKDIFLVEDKNFKYTTAGKFYEEPTIKYLAKPGEQKNYSLRNRKPAYVSQENFVITLLNMLSNKGRGVSEWDKIKFSVETNALHLEPETLKMFQDFVKRSDDNFEQFVNLLQNQFADTMDRVNGWYKRKISTFIFFIGLIFCVVFNVDSIRIVKILSNDEEKRLKMVELAEKVIDQKNGVDSLMTKKDSIDELKYKMEAHGMVKNSVLEANDIVAAGWEFTFNQDTLRIPYNKRYKYLCTKCIDSKNITSIEKLINGFNLKINKINKTEAELSKLSDKALKDSIESIKILEEKLLLNLDTLNNLTNVKFSAKHPIQVISKNQNLILAGTYEKTLSQKAYFVLCQFFNPFKSTFWGICITALALTLGAQFWFDLLKKLIALRGNGVKPEESEEKKKQLEKLKLTGDKVTSKDPVEIVISENRGYWERLPGFIAVNKSNKAKTIDIVVEEGFDLTQIEKTVNTIDGKHTIYTNIIKGEKGKYLIGNGYIYFKNSEKRGSIAGIFYNKKTKRNCYLTCAHVVQNDKNGHFNSDDNIIRDKESHEVGRISNIISSSYLDTAVIDINTAVNLDQKYEIGSIFNIISIDKVGVGTSVKIRSFDIVENHIVEIKGIIEMPFFDYTFEGNKYMYRMCLIKHNGNDQAKGGDSGSLVVDENNIPIALLIGSVFFHSTNYSICIYLEDILNSLFISTVKT